MRDKRPERAGGLDEKEATHAAGDHREAARGGSGPQSGRNDRSGLPKAGDQRTDVSSLAASLRRDEGAGDGADERVGKRKRAAEEDRGAASHGHRRAKGSQPKKLVSPAGRRRAVEHLLEEWRYTERSACRLVKQPRATQRYEARINYEERRIRKRLHELAKKHPGSGYRRMTRLLRREGMKINKKRVQRLWREEGLRHPLRKRRKRSRGHSENSCAMKKAEYKNHVWCWDFTMDETSEGRRLKWFSVMDEFTRECLALEVERRMTARDVVVILTWLEAKRGAPGAIRSDNGPEFIARAVGRWLAARKVGSLYIAPGSPWENGYSESFNSRMKAEFADREVFGSLLEAKVLGAEYQRYWNQERLHSGIGYKTPAEFAAELGPDSATLRPPQVRSQNQPTLISTGT